MSESLKKIISDFHAKDIIWTDNTLANTPFYVGYFCRTRLDKAIASQVFRARGMFLDVGCGIKPYEKIFGKYVDKYYGIEYSPESGYRGNRADVAADAGEMPFADESFDTILCTEVMEHVMNPEKVIAEIARILRPDGVAIVTVPFFYPIHDTFDFFRYTDKGIAIIMERHGLEIEEVRPLSGTGITIAMLLNMYIFEVGFMWTKWLYPIGVVLRPLLWILIALINLGGWLAEKVIPSKQMAFNHLTVARKTRNAK